jgi:hypothetical protein
VATAALDGTPNVSPKGTFPVLEERTIAFDEIRSPGTIRNLRANPRIEVNFVDVFVRKGYRFAGTATVVERGETNFERLLPKLRSAFAHRIRAIVVVAVNKALPTFEKIAAALDKGEITLAFNRKDGGSDILVPIDLTVSNTDDTWKKTHSQKMVTDFYACTGELLKMAKAGAGK